MRIKVKIFSFIKLGKKMHIFEQQTQVFQNSNGHMRKAFKIVKGSDSKVMELKGITNKKNPSIYHILKTLKKNNMEIHQFYKINENDIMRLLKEGNEENLLKDLKKKEVKKEEKKKIIKKEEKKKIIKKEEKKKIIKKVKKEEKKKIIKKVKKEEKKKVIKK